MSIATEISRIKDAKDAIRASIIAKGVNVPQAAKLDTYADRIDEIVQTASGNMEVVTSSPSGTINAADNKFYMLSADAGALVFNLPAMQQGGHGIYLLMTTTSTSAVSFTATGGVTINFPSGFQVEADKCYLMDFEFAQSEWQVSVEEWFVNGGGGEANKYIIAPSDATVEAIDKTKFSGKTLGLDLVIPEGVTNTLNDAFASWPIKSVVIPSTFTGHVINGVTLSVSNGAFYNCKQLQNVTIKEGCTSLGSYTFPNCDIHSVTIPRSFKKSGIAGNYIIINDYDFYSNKNLTNVILPQIQFDYLSIRNNAFYNCTSFTGFTNIPEGCSIDIGSAAFYNCTSLTDIPRHITGNFGDSTFDGCTSLTGTFYLGNINASGSSGHGTKFFNNTGIEEVIWEEAWPVDNYHSLARSFFENCKSLRRVQFPQQMIIADAGSYNDKGFFAYCESLQEVVWPTNLTTFPYKCFYYAKNISKNLFVPVSQFTSTSLSETFSGTTFSDTTLDISDYTTITTIGGSTIATTNLVCLVLPSSITNMSGYMAIGNNKALTTVVMNSVNPPTLGSSNYTFTGSYVDTHKTEPDLASIYVPDESVDTYKAATGWSQYAAIIKPLSEYVPES